MCRVDARAVVRLRLAESAVGRLQLEQGEYFLETGNKYKYMQGATNMSNTWRGPSR